MRASLRALLAAALLCAAPLAARGQDGGNPLVQSGIVAEATAESAVQARDRAHAQARRAAFQRLAAALGTSAPSVSDGQLEAWTTAIIVEEERTSPTRYAGRLTVRFSPSAASALGRSVGAPTPLPGVPGGGGGGGVAQSSVTATAVYAGFGEWRDLRSRLRSSGAVSSLEILSIRTDGATLRLNLRGSSAEAQAGLAATGVAVEAASGAEWRIGLAGGG